MKSFSSASFAGDYTEQLQRALAAVNEDPQALFSDFQWFLFEAKDAVYFTAFSKLALNREELYRIVAEMVALAPQLTHGFVGARPGEPFPQHLLDAITKVTMVDDFEGYPDKVLGRSIDIYGQDDLPLFRVEAVVRRGGPDELGRASLVQVRASHALLEGSDSALLTRSSSAAHGVMSDKRNKVGMLSRVKGFLRAQAFTWMYIIMGN